MLKDKLKECRLRCGFSQQQIGDVLNTHRSTYSFYESGKTEPSVENLRLLAMIFGVSLDELLEMEPRKTADAGLSDGGYDPEFAYLKEDSVNRVKDLTRDEKTLIMRFRIMTDRQRKELLELLKNPGGEGKADNEE